MHRPIQDGLEDYLGGRKDPSAMKAFHQHLAACETCRAEVDSLARQSALLRVLRAPAPVEPAPGFYARVIERIESQRSLSFWSVFLEPWMAKRIAFASLCLLVLLGSTVMTTDPMGEPNSIAATPVGLMATDVMPAADGSDPHHDRAVVLTTLASFGGSGAPLIQTSSD